VSIEPPPPAGLTVIVLVVELEPAVFVTVNFAV
jgi:hypothetical protein